MGLSIRSSKGTAQGVAKDWKETRTGCNASGAVDEKKQKRTTGNGQGKARSARGMRVERARIPGPLKRRRWREDLRMGERGLARST
eukprot:15484217-Alexandrium_andersonii.AAC.1